MYNRIIDFVNRFEILYPLQFGFRNGGVFLDLSKSF